MVSLPSNLTEVVHNDQAYLTSSRRQPFLSEQLKDRTLAGRPPAGSTGTYTFTVTASNGVSPGATQTFTLTVNTPVKQQAPAFTSAGSVHFTVGQVGSFTVTAGEFPVATFGPVSGLPSGLTFTDNGNNTATLAGTAAAGTECTYSFTLTAKNSVGTATQKFTLTINEAPKITSAPAALFTVGTTGSFSVTTKAGFPKGTNVSEKGALPASLVFLPGSQGKAILQGTPAVGSGGVYTITLTASNSAASGQQSFVLTVDEASGFTGAHTASFTEGTAGSFKVTTRGFPRPTFTRRGLAPGPDFHRQRQRHGYHQRHAGCWYCRYHPRHLDGQQRRGGHTGDGGALVHPGGGNSRRPPGGLLWHRCLALLGPRHRKASPLLRRDRG